MDVRLIQFAKHLEKKVLNEGKEYTLRGILHGELLCQNESPELIPIDVNDTKMIFNSEKELRYSSVWPDLALCRAGNDFVDGTTVIQKSTEEKEQAIIDAICYCSGITPADLHVKTKKPEIAWSRYIHVLVRNKIIYKDQTIDYAGKPYNKKHAMIIYGENVIKNLLETDAKFRNKYREAFNVIAREYPESISLFNLTWL
jgi:hypothetical protein